MVSLYSLFFLVKSLILFSNDFILFSFSIIFDINSSISFLLFIISSLFFISSFFGSFLICFFGCFFIFEISVTLTVFFTIDNFWNFFLFFLIGLLLLFIIFELSLFNSPFNIVSFSLLICLRFLKVLGLANTFFLGIERLLIFSLSISSIRFCNTSHFFSILFFSVIKLFIASLNF